MDESYIKGMIALHCKLAQMEGYKLDKKCKKYNDMYDYIRVCGGFSPQALWEAVETSIVGNEMYTGEPFDIEQYKWMLS